MKRRKKHYYPGYWKLRKWMLLLIIAILMYGGQSIRGFFQLKKDTTGVDFEVAKITKVTDGDTIHVDLDGENKTIRFIGVDTPESVHSDSSRNTSYGKIASKFTKRQLKIGQTIYLQKDVTSEDQYGRLLRYVWLEQPESVNNIAEIKEKMYNAILVEKGYARAAKYRPNVEYADTFEKLQNNARNNKKGLWKDSGWIQYYESNYDE